MSSLLQSIGPLLDKGLLKQRRMRFSIKSLLVLVLLSALVASLLRTAHTQYQIAQAESSLRSSFADHVVERRPYDLDEIALSLDRSEEHLRNRMSEQTKLYSTLKRAFHQDAARFKITPVDNKLSVLESPTIRQPNIAVHRHWQLNVPDNAKLAVAIDFLNKIGRKQTTPDSFNDQTLVTVPLKPGLHEIICLLQSANEIQEGQLSIQLDGELLLDRVHKPQKNSGSVSYTLNFRTQ
ncbi:MAG: hypothetical protein WBD20_25830, partial [Pirellulaceae bacterium]